MERNFNRGNQRCGFYDEAQLPHGGPESDRERRAAEEDFRYNREGMSKTSIFSIIHQLKYFRNTDNDKSRFEIYSSLSDFQIILTYILKVLSGSNNSTILIV